MNPFPSQLLILVLASWVWAAFSVFWLRKKALAYKSKSKEDITAERGPGGRKYQRFEEVVADLPRLEQAVKVMTMGSGAVPWAVVILVLTAFRSHAHEIRSLMIAGVLLVGAASFVMHSVLSLMRAKRKRVLELAKTANISGAEQGPVGSVFICPNCGRTAKYPGSSGGPTAFESLLWSLFLFPGLLYALRHARRRKHRCPACGAEIKS